MKHKIGVIVGHQLIRVAVVGVVLVTSIKDAAAKERTTGSRDAQIVPEGCACGQVGIETETEAAMPYTVAIDMGGGFGSFTVARFGISLSRSFWNRLFVEAAIHYDVGKDLSIFVPSLRVALLFKLAPRWSLSMGYRVGLGRSSYRLFTGTLWSTAAIWSVVTEALWRITRQLELRISLLSFHLLIDRDDTGALFTPYMGLGYRF